MLGSELMERLSIYLNRPLEGLVLRRMVGGKMLAHRVNPDEMVELRDDVELVALVCLSPAELNGQVVPSSHR